MPTATASPLRPRKTPIQARSTVTVEAILQATIQVLLDVGKEQLTTTRVSIRAGVSVGTLYQYFPNKRSLLQAALRRHIEGVSDAIMQACTESRSKGLPEMATALTDAYLAAKMRNIRESVTLYAVSSDIDGAAIVKAASARSHRWVAELFASTRDKLTKDPEIIATMVLAALNGVARRVLEAKSPERQMESLRKEVIELVLAYLRTCTV